MCSQGHDPNAISHYSLPKLRLYYNTGVKRVERERAITEVAITHSLASVLGAFFDKKESANYKRRESELVARANGVSFDQDQAKNLAGWKAQLMKAGVKRSYGRAH